MNTTQENNGAGLNALPSMHQKAIELGARARARRLYASGILSASEAGAVLRLCCPLGSYRARSGVAGIVERARRARDWSAEQRRTRGAAMQAQEVRARGGVSACAERFKGLALAPDLSGPRARVDRAGSVLLRGLYRAADKWGDDMAARWMGANAKKLTDATFREGATGAGWVRGHRVAIRCDGSAAESDTRADVLAAYRAEVLAAVPRVARAVAKWRGRAGAVAAIIAAAKRATRKRASRAAHAALYQGTGRDGREVAADWVLQGEVHSDMEETLKNDALLSLLGEGVPCLRSVPSSDPCKISSGGFGRRSAAEVEIAAAVARARAVIAQRLALAAAGGKGAGAVKVGAVAASGILHHLQQALSGGGLSEAFAARLTAGKDGGIPDDLRQSIKRFRDLVGIVKG